MPVVHAIRTGSVKVRTAQRRRSGNGGLHRVLFDRSWTEWLPIHAWAVEHDAGVIVIDTGETARSMQPGYFPRWHPYYRLAVRMDVRPEDEIGPQLRRLGIDPSDVRTVVLTHLHTDHAGGLHHFPGSEILVDGGEHERAQGFGGQLQGYLPHHWPDWFDPTPIALENRPLGSFPRSMPLTESGDVSIVPTPGHTPNHVSVIVRGEETSWFLAGDTSYTQRALIDRHPDGVSQDAEVALETIDRILRFAADEPTVYLPSHDPAAADRLRDRVLLDPAASLAGVEAF